MKNVIELLEKKYQYFTDQRRDWNFFLGLADYVKYSIKTSEIDKILQYIVKKRADDEKKLKELGGKIIKETKQAKERLCKIIKEHNISYESLNREIEEYKDYENGTMQSSRGEAEALSDALKGIIRNLFQNGYKALIKDFAIEHKEALNRIGEYTFSKTLNSYYEEKENYNDKKQVEIWGNWDNLVLVYLTIYKKKETFQKLKKENFYKSWNFVGVAGEMKKIRDGSINRLTMLPSEFEPIHFIREDYIVHASRVHNYLIQELNLEQEVKANKFDKEVLKTKQLLDKIETDIEERTKEQEQFEVKVKDRKIWVNDYILSKPHAVGSNYEFFEYIRSQPFDTLIKRETLPSKYGDMSLKGQVKNKSFIKIINELGFKGEILKAFFYKRSKDSLIYRGDKIKKEDLNNAGIRFSLFIKELELAHIKNSPE